MPNLLARSFEGELAPSFTLHCLEPGRIASAPEGPVTRDRSLLGVGLRSFHLRHARRAHGVHEPVHIIYYRLMRSASIEVVRVLHERMDPTAHLDAVTQRRTPGKRSRS